jgi:hypothetical protein
MFCTSCGKEIPDGSTVCGVCGKPIVSAVIPKAEQGSGKAATDVNVGAYLKDFFSDPVSAVLSRSKDTYLVWGLIIAAIYPLVMFFQLLFADYDYEFKYCFAIFFIALCGVAAFVFALFLFQTLFKVEKKSLPTIVASVGLSMTPMFALYIVGLIMDAILAGGSVASAFVIVGYVFSGIVLSKFFDADKDNNRSRSTLLVVISLACALFIQTIFQILVFNAMY